MSAADRIALQIGRLIIQAENQAHLIAALQAESEAAKAELALLAGDRPVTVRERAQTQER